jgi:hypothetical protein
VSMGTHTLLFSRKGHQALLIQETLKIGVQHFPFVQNCIPWYECFADSWIWTKAQSSSEV